MEDIATSFFVGQTEMWVWNTRGKVVRWKAPSLLVPEVPIFTGVP